MEIWYRGIGFYFEDFKEEVVGEGGVDNTNLQPKITLEVNDYQ